MDFIEVRDLKKYFPVRANFFSKINKVVHAVDGVSFNIHEKETVGLVGESGCGKTTVARLILNLITPTSGTIRFNDQDILTMNNKELKKLRRDIQIIFQNPFGSLNPRKTVNQILTLPYRLQTKLEKEEIKIEILNLLEIVGLSPGEQYINRYPHEFSGGQRQRIGIARAISLHPKFIVADEPVSSLDISVKAQILNLMKCLQEDYGLTYMFITHDLATVRSFCNRIIVMYLGKILEHGNITQIFENPLHPYTEALLSATPIPNPIIARKRKKIMLKGSVPDPVNPPTGCRFHTRCSYSETKCIKIEPGMIQLNKDQFVACHLRC